MKIYSRLAVLLLSSMTLIGTAVRAQAPPAAAKKVYTRKMEFHLPIQIDSKDRDTLSKIQLWVKDGPSGIWTMKNSVDAMESKFTYHVDHDGEYWFSVVTVDKSGVSRPGDVSKETPGLMVVVDTQPPTCDVHAVTLSDGSAAVKCSVSDANPDPASLKVEYRGDSSVWQILQPMNDSPGLYRVPENSPHGTVRVTATDLARNSSTREVNPWSGRPVSGPALVTVSTTPLLESQSDKRAVPLPMPTGQPSITPVAAQTVEPTAPVHSQPTVKHGRSMQLINSIHASLDYQIDEAGPSGIGRVEVWLTRDEGQTWTKLCEDPDRRSPVDIDLPGDGLYGVSLVVSNGNGVAGAPPVRGDRPSWWIEVDTTKPDAKLLDIHASSEDPSVFQITWEASDKNMKQDPIDLYYCTQRGGLWVPIARSLPNSGHYNWSVPRNAGTEFYIRMDVSDRAGNVAHCDAKQPVYLDLSHPKAHVLGISTGARPYSGN